MKLLLILVFAVPALLSAQIKATTETGEQVYLMENGTWTYIKEDTTEEKVVNKECGELVQKTFDEISGKELIFSTPIQVGDNGSGFQISLNIDKKYTTAFFTFNQAVCVDQGSTISILFQDGSRLSLTNDSKYNCSGSVVVYFGGPYGRKSDLVELSTKEVKAVRVWKVEGYSEGYLSAQDSRDLIGSFACLRLYK